MAIKVLTSRTTTNENTAGSQCGTEVAVLADGSYVVVWADSNPDPSTLIYPQYSPTTIVFQHYSAAGQPIGDNQTVPVDTLGQFNRGAHDVIGTADGGFAITYQIVDSRDRHSIFEMKFYAPDGTLTSSETLYSGAFENSWGSNLFSVGGFTWVTGTATDGNPDPFLRVFNAANVEVTAFSTDDLLGDTTRLESSLNGVKLVGSDVAVIAYGSSRINFARVDTNTGGVIGDTVGIAEPDLQFPRPKVLALTGGGFIVSYAVNNSGNPNNRDYDVAFKVYNADGSLEVNETLIHVLTDGAQQSHDVGALPNGGFIAIWVDESEEAVFARIFGADGQPQEGTKLIDSPGIRRPSLDAELLPDGRIIITLDDNEVTTMIIDPLWEVPPDVDELLLGTSENDTIYGYGGNDTIMGLEGNDFLDGGSGIDEMSGGLGSDKYIVRHINDIVIETAGEGWYDTVYAEVNYTLPDDSSIEVLRSISSSRVQNINLTGNGFDQTISGDAGNNILEGGGGADTLIGFGGDDVYIVRDSAVVVVEEGDGGRIPHLYGFDKVFSSVSLALPDDSAVEVLRTISTRSTQDINLTGNGSHQVIMGNAGENVLDGSFGDDTLLGMDGHDTLIGQNGDDYLDGGTGTDEMWGGNGNDTFYVSDSSDSVFDGADKGILDRVLSAVSYVMTPGSYIEFLSTQDSNGVQAINLTGNIRSQTITGNAGNNQLDGGAGNDTLVGLEGNDTLIGQEGNDVLRGNIGGTNVMFGGAGDDVIVVRSETDTVFEDLGQGNDTVMSSVDFILSADSYVEDLRASSYNSHQDIDLTGNEFDQIIAGNYGDNRLSGMGGAIL